MAVLQVDLATGDRRVISGVDPQTGILQGAGPPFSNPAGIVVLGDGRLVVTDNGLDAVLLVDAVNGNRTIISGFEPDTGARLGDGPRFTLPQGIAVATDGALLVVDWGLAAVLRVDPVTSNRSIVSQVNIGTGPPLPDARGIAARADLSLVVAENDLNAVVGVNSLTANRTTLSGVDFDTDAPIGGGPQLEYPMAVAVEADGNLIVADAASSISLAGLRALVRVDAVSGDRRIISDENTGGPPFDLPVSVAVEANGQLVVVDQGLRALVRVDPTDGSGAIISSATDGIGGSPPFTGPRDIAIAEDGNFFVVDQSGIFLVDALNGDRSLLLVAGGDLIPRAVAIEATGTLVVIDALDEEVERVNPKTGRRSLVSGAGRGRGPTFLDPRDLTILPNGTLIVLDGAFGLKAVIAVDPVSGDRTIVSK